YGRRGVRICRAPRLTGRIENHAASKEQVLVRTEGEPGRLAERHGKQGLQRPVRIDSRNGPARRVPIYFGDRDVEPVPRSHTGCSAPLVAFVNVILGPSERCPVCASTWISVANGGESALFTARRSPCSGSKATSSARRSGA